MRSNIGARCERLRESVEDDAFSKLDPNRVELNRHDVAKDINREARKSVAFGVNQTIGIGLVAETPLGKPRSRR